MSASGLAEEITTLAALCREGVLMTDEFNVKKWDVLSHRTTGSR